MLLIEITILKMSLIFANILYPIDLYNIKHDYHYTQRSTPTDYTVVTH